MTSSKLKERKAKQYSRILSRHWELSKNISFIYSAYNPRCWYWEIVELFRRLLLSAILPSMFYGLDALYPMNIFFTVLFMKLYSLFKPHGMLSENILAEVGQFQLFVTFVIAMGVKFKAFDDLPSVYIYIDIILIFVNSSVVLFSLVLAGIDYRRLKTTILPEELISNSNVLLIQKHSVFTNLDLLNSSHRRTDIRHWLTKQSNQAILKILDLIRKELQRRDNLNAPLVCTHVYYYAMTPLASYVGEDNYAITKDVIIVGSFDNKTKIRYLRYDTSNIGQIEFITLHNEITRIPEEAFDRNLYRSRHNSIVTNRLRDAGPSLPAHIHVHNPASTLMHRDSLLRYTSGVNLKFYMDIHDENDKFSNFILNRFEAGQFEHSKQRQVPGFIINRNDCCAVEAFFMTLIFALQGWEEFETRNIFRTLGCSENDFLRYFNPLFNMDSSIFPLSDTNNSGGYFRNSRLLNAYNDGEWLRVMKKYNKVRKHVYRNLFINLQEDSAIVNAADVFTSITHLIDYLFLKDNICEYFANKRVVLNHSTSLPYFRVRIDEGDVLTHGGHGLISSKLDHLFRFEILKGKLACLVVFPKILFVVIDLSVFCDSSTSNLCFEETVIISAENDVLTYQLSSAIYKGSDGGFSSLIVHHGDGGVFLWNVLASASGGCPEYDTCNDKDAVCIDIDKEIMYSDLSGRRRLFPLFLASKTIHFLCYKLSDEILTEEFCDDNWEVYRGSEFV